MSDRVYRGSLLLGVLASAGVVGGIAAQEVVIGSAAGRSVYGYIQSFSAHSLIVGLLAACAAGSALCLPMPQPGRQEWVAVAWWLLVALGLQAFIRSLTLFPFDAIFASENASSFYGVTERYDAFTVLRRFSVVQRESALHAQSNMPGKIMLVYLLRVISERPDVLAWLAVFVSNLGGVLMYLLVRNLFADRTVALYSMVLYLFVPGKLLFFPLMNTVTPVLVLAALCVLQWWLRTGAMRIAALLGVLLYALVFFEPLPLVMGLVFASLSARAILRGELTWQAFVLHSSIMVLAFVAAALAVEWSTGFNLLDTFARIGAHATEFNTLARRRYSIWVWANLWEFAIGAGICQVVLFGSALARELAAKRGREVLLHPLPLLCLSVLAVLLVTDAIGLNRGEVVRLWIFLACFFQIPAAFVCARLHSPIAIGAVAGTSLVHAAVSTSMVGFVIP